MLEDPRYTIEGLTLPRGGRIRDQTFADDTILYLKGEQANMDKTQGVLETFCKAFGAKINWNKSVAIWASRRKRAWCWGQEVGLKWILEGEGVRYLGVQVGFCLPTEANFDKMMAALKGKLISWSHNNLSFAGRILVANQVILASMWYLAACWNPNPKMCSQVRGVVKNFIWGGKAMPTRAKVKLRQPLFGNPSFTNTRGALLGVSGQSEGCAFAKSGHTRVRDIWNQEAQV
jgi:hypothetical protein